LTARASVKVAPENRKQDSDLQYSIAPFLQFSSSPATPELLPQNVQILAGELKPYLDRPYILYRYSVGALIAFELARELPRQNVDPPISAEIPEMSI
jgi:hypothetical protein